jgi:hypothetical protein
MGQVKVRNLHLAAYMKAHGARLLNVENSIFVFETNVPISEWRVSHRNSCCRTVDRELIGLRKLIKG